MAASAAGGNEDEYVTAATVTIAMNLLRVNRDNVTAV